MNLIFRKRASGHRGPPFRGFPGPSVFATLQLHSTLFIETLRTLHLHFVDNCRPTTFAFVICAKNGEISACPLSWRFCGNGHFPNSVLRAKWKFPFPLNFPEESVRFP